MASSSKLAARLAEIDATPWSAEEKARVSQLAIRNAETYDSITDGGRYILKGEMGGTEDALPPRQPHDNDPHSRIAWQDAFDPS